LYEIFYICIYLHIIVWLFRTICFQRNRSNSNDSGTISEYSKFFWTFFQTSYRNNTETVRRAEGLVSYKRPGKMRWLYEVPEEQLLVTNGETLWLFDSLLENVTIQKLEKLTDGTALSFLLGLGDLQADFNRRLISQVLLTSPDALIVELEPKKAAANLSFIQLAVNPVTYNLQIIALMDQEGNYRTIELGSMHYNLVLEDNFFEFKVTQDMEVIEAGN